MEMSHAYPLVALFSHLLAQTSWAPEEHHPGTGTGTKNPSTEIIKTKKRFSASN
jgi:hypothetical protein